MDSLLTTQLAVTNMCHEIANRMSIIKFLQEDVVSDFKNGVLSEDSLEGLFAHIDDAILSMDFFRNLYSPSESKNEILKISLKICEKKDIKIVNFTTQFEESFSSSNVGKAIAAILFFLTKINNSKFSVIFSTIEKAIIMDIRGCTGELQKRLIAMLNANEDDENTFNTIAHYIKSLLLTDKLFIKTDNKIVDTLRIKICK